MSLFLIHHPWPGDTMAREEMLDLVAADYESWQAQRITWVSYLGTPNNGEGWCLMQAPSRDALLRMFHENRIPYLSVTEVWQISERDLNLAAEAGLGHASALRVV